MAAAKMRLIESPFQPFGKYPSTYFKRCLRAEAAGTYRIEHCGN